MEIKITTGSKLDTSNIMHQHLVFQHLANPKSGWDGLIMYAERRYLFTLLVSGLSNPEQRAYGFTPTKGDKAAIKTMVKPIPEGELVDNLYWKFSVMGKVARSTRVIRAIGQPTKSSASKGGTFTLEVADGTIKHQMNVFFPNGKIARVMYTPRPTGTGSFYCDFECYPGDEFSWASWMLGKNSIYGSFSTVGERSREGYTNFFFPDSYINHVTKQRIGFTISGDAETQGIVWYETEGKKGFTYVAETIARRTFLLQDDDQKFHGISTMRDSFGNLLSTPSMYDEKGDPIVAGDGWIEQIRGYNEFIASGSDGMPTEDDLYDMVTSLDEGRDHDSDEPWIVITGAPGMKAAKEVARKININDNIQYTMSLDPNSTEFGGQKVSTGINMIIINIGGKQVRFVENPQFNNREKYPWLDGQGRSVMNSTWFFMDRSNLPNGRQSVEIRARGGNGRNRNLIYGLFAGMTGGPDKPLHPGDFSSFQMFKENMTCVYRPKANGIIRPNISLL